MAQWTPLKRDTLDSLADEFLHNYAKGRTIIAIDGGPDAGAAVFADDFAARLGKGSHAVFRASLGDFHLPGWAERPLWDSFDYPLFRRVLVEPFRMAGSTGFVTAGWDAARDQPIEMEWKTGPQDATLVVDGLYLNRPELRGIWNWSVWLDGVVSTSVPKPYGTERPRTRASVIVDNGNPEHPRRVSADSC